MIDRTEKGVQAYVAAPTCWRFATSESGYRSFPLYLSRRKNFSKMPITRNLIDHMQPALCAMTPQRIATESFIEADAAVDRLIEIYERNTGFLRDSLTGL
jgi:hypothetical protein